MTDLQDITTWKQELGLLPILLNPKKNKTSFLMLNDGQRDFCLQLNGTKKTDTYYFSASWSCNTSIFLVVDDVFITSYNWAKKSIKQVDLEVAESGLDEFYKNLFTDLPTISNNVIQYTNTLFSSYRNFTQEKKNPVKTLNIFLSLLSTLENEKGADAPNNWSLEKHLLPNSFEADAVNLKLIDGFIKPQLDLILGFASSELFKETEKEITLFDAQRDLFGEVSTTVESDNSDMHHTPNYLTTSIVENVLSQVDLSKKELFVFDPVCNSGEYLLAFLKQLKQLNYKGKVKVLGWDTSKTSVVTTNYLLAYEQEKNWGKKLTIETEWVENPLSKSWETNFDIILMNPPYISWDLLNNDERTLLKKNLGFNFKGQPNLSSAYLFKAINSLAEKGVIGSVIPSAMLTLDSYKNLRDDIYYNLAIKIIAKLGNFIFDNTNIDVSMFIGKKEKTFEIPQLIWIDNQKEFAQKALHAFRKMNYKNEAIVDHKNFSIYIPDTFPLINESWKPISLKDTLFIKNIGKGVNLGNLVSIDALFDVKQGIRQGAKNIFKLSASSFRRLPENEKQYFRPVIDNEAIKNGALNKKHFIWFPYDKDGELFKTESNLADKAPYFYSIILKPHKTILEARGGITDWWGLSRPRHWQFVKETHLYSTEFGKSDSFAFDSEGDFVAERGNAWIPINEFSDADSYFYLAIFSSDYFNKLLSIYAKQLLSGWDLGKKYTKNIPIPNINSERVKNSDEYLKLVEIGKSLSKGNDNPNLKNILDTILLQTFYTNT